MKKLVRINAIGVKSKFGYVLESDEDCSIIKVSNPIDWLSWLKYEHCILLGNVYLSEVNIFDTLNGVLKKLESYFNIKIMEDEYIIKHIDKLIYCFENKLSLIDFDSWTYIEDLIKKKISFQDYCSIDKFYDCSLLELCESDMPSIKNILLERESNFMYCVCCGSKLKSNKVPISDTCENCNTLFENVKKNIFAEIEILNKKQQQND